MATCIGNIVSLYSKRGFKIETILADPEFGPVKDRNIKKFGITLNPNSKGEHVP